MKKIIAITCITFGIFLLDTSYLCHAQTPPASATQTSNTNLLTNPQLNDAVIVKAKGFEIKQSDLDKVLTDAKANASKQGQTLPSEFSVSVLNQLITIQILLQTASADDKTTGKIEADLQYTNLINRFGSTEAFETQLKAVGMTVDELRGKATQEAIAKAALKRELNIVVSDDEAMAFYAKHMTDFAQPETASTSAKQFAYTDMLPQVNKTVAEICKGELESEKIKELAPDYLKKLRSEQQVEITNPALKALDESVRAQAESTVVSPKK